MSHSETDRPDPSIITSLATGYWASMVLIAANRLGVFTALSEGRKTASEIAQACGTGAHKMELLLNACVAQRLLIKEGNSYRNSATSRTFLVRGNPAFLGDALKYTEDLYPIWGQLEQTLRDNRPPLESQDYLGVDAEKTRNFVLGMHNRALGIAATVVAGLNLEGRRQVLDVGGGPGTYSILLVRKTPGLRATVFDLPPIVKIAREIIDSYDCGDRIKVAAGSYLVDEFVKGNDVVLMSGMMHRELPDTCRMLLAKAYKSLEPGGMVIVSDVMFDNEAHTSPSLSALFALNMMLTSESGSAHSIPEMERWMSEQGFIEIDSRSLPPPMSHVALQTGRKA